MAFFATFWTWGFPPAKVRGARGEARKSKKFDLPPFYNGKMTVWETESVGDFQRICVNGGGDFWRFYEEFKLSRTSIRTFSLM